MHGGFSLGLSWCVHKIKQARSKENLTEQSIHGKGGPHSGLNSYSWALSLDSTNSQHECNMRWKRIIYFSAMTQKSIFMFSLSFTRLTQAKELDYFKYSYYLQWYEHLKQCKPKMQQHSQPCAHGHAQMTTIVIAILPCNQKVTNFQHTVTLPHVGQTSIAQSRKSL